MSVISRFNTEPLPVHLINQIYAGTSGLVLPVANKTLFPPEFRNRSRLSFYASLYNSIEVNSSFYRIPMKKTTARWETEVPDHFRFSFKMFRDITHNKGLVFDEQVLNRFMESINGVQTKRGALLVQLPPGTGYDPAQLELLLTRIIADDPDRSWKLNVEFRNSAWYNKDCFALLEALGVGLVLHDMPRSIPPSFEPWTDFAYLRFHGIAGDYRGSYSKDNLQPYADTVNRWLARGKSVYIYFNNTIGEALINLNDFLSGFNV